MTAHRQQRKAREKNFSPAQLSAIDLLASGANITRTAEAVGVDRSTVSQWYNSDGFHAAVDSRRSALWSEYEDELRSLLPLAFQAIREELQNPKGKRLRAAEVVLRATNIKVQRDFISLFNETM